MSREVNNGVSVVSSESETEVPSKKKKSKFSGSFTSKVSFKNTRKEIYAVTVKLKATLLCFIASLVDNILNVAMLANKTLKNLAKQTITS